MKRELSKTEYNTIHVWNLRHWKKTGICEHCKEQKKTDWSSKSGNYIKGDKRDWQELCKKCHYKYDVEVLGRVSMVETGRLGGLKSRGGGFADRELASRAGRLGGLKSRRT